jgi:hypothetical protein
MKRHIWARLVRRQGRAFTTPMGIQCVSWVARCRVCGCRASVVLALTPIEEIACIHVFGRRGCR